MTVRIVTRSEVETLVADLATSDALEFKITSPPNQDVTVVVLTDPNNPDYATVFSLSGLEQIEARDLESLVRSRYQNAHYTLIEGLKNKKFPVDKEGQLSLF